MAPLGDAAATASASTSVAGAASYSWSGAALVSDVQLWVDKPGQNYSITTTLYTGEHVLTAVATDNAGATATSAAVTNTGTTVPITNPIAERIPKGDIAIDLQTVAEGLAAPLSVSALLNLIDGSTYVNFQTTNNPPGEIRGQIMR